ncbi:Uncharacterized protein APZ42_005342, partial [Daphnia magna]
TTSIGCIPALFRDCSLLASFKEAPIHCVFTSFIDCIPNIFRDRYSLHSSNRPHFIVFSPAVLTTIQHFSVTVPFCIPQTSPNSLFSPGLLIAFQHF